MIEAASAIRVRQRRIAENKVIQVKANASLQGVGDVVGRPIQAEQKRQHR
jgi:hypothetical protein